MLSEVITECILSAHKETLGFEIYCFTLLHGVIEISV